MIKLLLRILLIYICYIPFMQLTQEYKYEKAFFNKKDSGYYEVNVEYPQIIDKIFSQKIREKVNKEIKQFIHKQFDDDLKLFIQNSKKTKEELDCSGIDSINITFKVIRLDEYCLSIKFDKDFYGMGAMHGLPSIAIFNYDFKKNRPLKLKDLFTAEANYLQQISDYCRSDLISQLKGKDNTQSVDTSLMKVGTKAIEKNFEQFGIEKDGLIIYFNVYQVASFAAGDQAVKIPFSKLVSFNVS